MKEFLLNMMSGALEQFGESKLKQLLQKLHDSDFTAYSAAIEGGLAFANALRPLSDRTASHIDDAILDGVVASIMESAAENAVMLDDGKVIVNAGQPGAGDSTGGNQPENNEETV